MKLSGRIEEVDQAIERVRREIERCGESDPELAAGYATGNSLLVVQSDIDRAMAAVETLDAHLRAVART